MKQAFHLGFAISLGTNPEGMLPRATFACVAALPFANRVAGDP